MNDEPILKVSTFVAAIAAIFSVLVVFGVNLSEDQQKAILAAIPAIAPFVIWYQARKGTVPVEKANAQIEKVAKQPAVTNTETIKALKFTKG